MKRGFTCVALWLLCAAFDWPGHVQQLAHDAVHGEPAQRKNALQQLASQPSEAARDAVLRGLDDAEIEVRLTAAESASKLRLTAATPALIDWLSEPDPRMRLAAARALGGLGDATAAAPLARLLGDNDAQLRHSAALALAKLGGPESVTPLLGRLDDPDPSVRLAAVEGLGAIGDVQAVAGLLGRVDDSAIEVRAAVLDALGALGDARAVDSLSAALSDPQEPVRLAAAAALGRLGVSTSVAALHKALVHADGRLSNALLAALGNVDADAARTALLAAMRGSERGALAAAALAENARRFDANAAAPQVLPALLAELPQATEHAHTEAVCVALLALARFTSVASAFDPLLARLNAQPNPEPCLFDALAVTHDPRALLPMLERLGQAEGPLRAALLDALERHFEHTEPEGQAADPLLQVLTQVESERRPQVVRLLGRVGETRALTTLRPLLDSDSPALVLATVEALGMIGDLQSRPALLELLGARDAELRRRAAIALAASADRALVDALLTRLAQHDGVDPHAVWLALGKSLAVLHAKGTLDATRSARAGEALRQTALGPDEALAARALQALAAWHPPGGGQLLGEVLRYPSSRRRYQAALALSRLPSHESRNVLRFLLRDANRRILPAAILALGEVGDANDVPKLMRLATRYPWPVPVATAYALARLARRGAVRGAAIQQALCELGASREPYVRANVAAGLAALGARPCTDGPDPLRWLAPQHAPAVRVAAARWAHAALKRDRIDAVAAKRALSRCARGDREPSVSEACSEATPPPDASGTELVAHASDGHTLLRDAQLAVRLADGLVFVARSDVNGELHLPASARGTPTLEDPSQAPLEPAP